MMASQTTNVIIAPMALNDLPAISEIERRAHLWPWSDNTLSGNFGTRYYNHILLREHKVIGYYIASQAGVEASLLNIAVDPDFQGAGYGRLLLQHLIDLSKQKQLQEIWLEVRVSNTAACKLYHQLGFVEVDRRKGYYPAQEGREDAIIMCCYL